MSGASGFLFALGLLSGMRGYEVLRRRKDFPKGSEVPIWGTLAQTRVVIRTIETLLSTM